MVLEYHWGSRLVALSPSWGVCETHPNQIYNPCGLGILQISTTFIKVLCSLQTEPPGIA